MVGHVLYIEQKKMVPTAAASPEIVRVVNHMDECNSGENDVCNSSNRTSLCLGPIYLLPCNFFSQIALSSCDYLLVVMAPD